MCCSGNRDLMARAILASITNDEETSAKLAAVFREAEGAPAPSTPAVMHDAAEAHEHPRHARRVEPASAASRPG